MSTLAQRAFQIMSQMSRPASGTDVRIRLGVDVAPDNIRRAIATLRQAGCISAAYRSGREKFYVIQPGARPPTDVRGASIGTLKRARLRSRASRNWVTGR